MGNIKYVSWLGFTPDELAGVKEYLESQAQKGWFPDPAYASLGLVLKRGEPESVTYFITYADFDETHYREGPWRYLGQFGKEHIFASRTSRTEPPGSSEEVQFCSAKYILLSRIIPVAGIFLLLMSGFIIMDLRNPAELLLDGRRLSDYGGMVFLVLLGMLFLMSRGLWICGNNLRLKKSKPVRWRGLTHARVRSWIILAVSVIVILGTGGYGAGPALCMAVYLLAFLLIPIIYSGILNISDYMCTKKGMSMPDGRRLRWIMAGIIMILMFLCTLLGVRAQEYTERQEETGIAGHELFRDEAYKWRGDYGNYDSGSILASIRRGYMESFKDIPVSADVTVYDSSYPWVRAVLMDHAIGGKGSSYHMDYSKLNTENGVSVREYQYSLIKQEMWGKDLPESYQIFVMESQNTIVRLEFNLGMPGNKALAEDIKNKLAGSCSEQMKVQNESQRVGEDMEDAGPEDDIPDAVVRELGLPVEHFYGTPPSGQWSAYGKLKGETFTYLLYNQQSGEMRAYSVSMKQSSRDARLLVNAQESLAAVSFHDGNRLGYKLISIRYNKVLNDYSVFEDERFRNELSLANQDFDALLSEQPRQWISDRTLEVGLHYRNQAGKSCYGTYQLKVASIEESGFEIQSADLDEEAAENQRVLEDMGQVSPDELTETEIKGWNSWDGIRYPLIARLPEDDIYLYGFSGNYYLKGVVLRYKDKIQTFPWSYAARDTLPKMAFRDYDQDGVKELAVSLYNGSGTGVSIEELHVLELGQDGAWTDHEFTEGRYERLFDQAVSFADDGEDEFELRLEGEAYRVKKMAGWTRIRDLSFINIVSFDLGKEMIMKVSPKIYPYNGSPVNDGWISAQVVYREGAFTLTGYSWNQEE